uniref:Uncharacterized protein n=1 Tax=Kalanchoe fedtschenkoi TaxID=63787 RepID=A0A7N0TW59_KALFE
MSTGRPPLPPSAAKSTALALPSGPASTDSKETKALSAPVGSTALVEYTPPVLQPEDEDLEVKLRRIIENVPVRVSNTSGSSAGSGSGDFHQVHASFQVYESSLTAVDLVFHVN